MTTIWGAIRPGAQIGKGSGLKSRRSQELVGSSPTPGMWAARAPFIAEHRAALVDFMEDALRQERWYFDPANHKEAVEIAAKVTKAPPAAFDSWLFEKKGEDGDYYRDPNGVPAIASIQSGIEEQQKLGLLKERIEVKNYVDLSLVEEAAKRLK